MRHEFGDLKISREDKLLILLARTDANKSEIESILKQEIDWTYLIQRAFKHKLTPILYWKLNDYIEYVPPDLKKQLKTFFQENIYENLLLLGELCNILDIFNLNNINAIPYKGPILAVDTYDNLALRQFDDIDIFIQKKDFQKAKKILLRLNYKSKLALDNQQEKIYLATQREYKFTNPKRNINLELHWNFIGLSFSGNWNYFKDPDTKYIKINNKQVSSLKTEDLILVLCTHVSGHVWHRLLWICDIAELFKREEIDWLNLFKKASELHLIRILEVNILLAVNLFNINIPEEILKKLKRDTELNKLVLEIEYYIFNNSKQDNFYQMLCLRLKIRENLSNKIKDFFLIIFKPTTNEWMFNPLPFFLYPLYYILRGLNLLRKIY